MYSNLYIHTITVSRRTKASANTLGENVYTYADIYTNVPARIEQYAETTQYRDSGQRPVNSTIVYIDPAYILAEQDKIYQDGTTYLGLIIGINPALDMNGGIDHYEGIIENP